MVLGSQAPRAESSRRYMTSSRRRGSRRVPLAIVVLVILVAVVYYFWPTGGTTDAATNQQSAQSPEQTTTTQNANAAAQPRPQASPNQQARPNQTPASQTPAAPTNATPPPAANNDRTAAPRPPVAVSTPTQTTTSVADRRVKDGLALLAEGQFVAGRAILSELLFATPAVLSPADADTIRATLADVNKGLIFSPEVTPNDPLAEHYVVKSGDRLARIAPLYKVPYQFIELINDTPAVRIRVDQRLKMVKGPFHARVSKREYRMDLFLRGSNGLPIYVTSVPVGLGEDDSTPLGMWRIKAGSKVQNPDWRNPRTGEYFRADDPKNPIGEYWLALEGLDDNTRNVTGYGIHGTIDQDSIGDQRSMGCIRLRDEDIKLMFKMLTDGESTVEIVR